MIEFTCSRQVWKYHLLQNLIPENFQAWMSDTPSDAGLHSKRIDPPPNLQGASQLHTRRAYLPWAFFGPCSDGFWDAPGDRSKCQNEGSQPAPRFLIGAATQLVWYIRRASGKLEEDDLPILLLNLTLDIKVGR